MPKLEIWRLTILDTKVGPDSAVVLNRRIVMQELAPFERAIGQAGHLPHDTVLIHFDAMINTADGIASDSAD